MDGSWARGYLGAVLSHGVVVEAGLGLELLPAVLTLQCILQLQAGMLVRGIRSGGASLPSQGQPYLLTHFHVLLKPHEGSCG